MSELQLGYMPFVPAVSLDPLEPSSSVSKRQEDRGDLGLQPRLGEGGGTEVARS